MLLKSIIVILFIAVLLSLTGGMRFLLKDIGEHESKRTLYALGIRISCAAALMITIAYGLASGQLRSTAPWDQARQAQPAVSP